MYEIGITGSMGPQTPVKMITMSWRRLPGGGYCATHIVHYDHRPLDLNDDLIAMVMVFFEIDAIRMLFEHKLP